MLLESGGGGWMALLPVAEVTSPKARREGWFSVAFPVADGTALLRGRDSEFSLAYGDAGGEALMGERSIAGMAPRRRVPLIRERL